MKFAKIYLVRHGAVENPRQIIYGYLPLPLSKKGAKEAKQAGIFLKDKKIGAIFSSPIKRTKDSAKIINQIISRGKLKIKFDKNLRESGFAEFMRGLTIQKAEKKYPKIWRLYWRQTSKVKTGESLEKMTKRFLKIISEAIKKNPGKNLVFISHRDPILAVLLKISKRSLDDLHKVKAICDTGSICEIWSVGKRLINKTYLAQ